MARGKGGGAKTPEGKARSSRNALKHGMFATKTQILPDEREEDFDRIRDGWLKEWQPKGFMEERLVEELIYNDWLLHRARRRVDEAEAEAAREGTPEAKQKAVYMNQLRAQAERSFYRTLAALNQLKRDIFRERQYEFKLRKEHTELLAENLRLRAEFEKRSPKPNQGPPPAALKPKEEPPKPDYYPRL